MMPTVWKLLRQISWPEASENGPGGRTALVDPPGSWCPVPEDGRQVSRFCSQRSIDYDQCSRFHDHYVRGIAIVRALPPVRYFVLEPTNGLTRAVAAADSRVRTLYFDPPKMATPIVANTPMSDIPRFLLRIRSTDRRPMASGAHDYRALESRRTYSRRHEPWTKTCGWPATRAQIYASCCRDFALWGGCLDVHPDVARSV